MLRSYYGAKCVSRRHQVFELKFGLVYCQRIGYSLNIMWSTHAFPRKHKGKPVELPGNYLVQPIARRTSVSMLDVANSYKTDIGRVESSHIQLEDQYCSSS